jgi:hypothetical protein
MNKSLVLLASFAGLVACFGEKKEEPTAEGQATTETCPADAAAHSAAPAVEEKKAEEPAAAPAETTETTKAQ